MESEKRTCFALIAATIVNKRRYNCVYDFQKGKYVNVSSSGLNSSYMSFFDYNRGGYVSGNERNMYDYPTSAYVSISVHNNSVSCFDYESSSYVDFVVSSNGISAFDYQLSRNYSYSVSWLLPSYIVIVNNKNWCKLSIFPSFIWNVEMILNFHP